MANFRRLIFEGSEERIASIKENQNAILNLRKENLALK
jgi:hypothetical protein